MLVLEFVQWLERFRQCVQQSYPAVVVDVWLCLVTYCASVVLVVCPWLHRCRTHSISQPFLSGFVLGRCDHCFLWCFGDLMGWGLFSPSPRFLTSESSLASSDPLRSLGWRGQTQVQNHWGRQKSFQKWPFGKKSWCMPSCKRWFWTWVPSHSAGTYLCLCILVWSLCKDCDLGLHDGPCLSILGPCLGRQAWTPQ